MTSTQNSFVFLTLILLPVVFVALLAVGEMETGIHILWTLIIAVAISALIVGS
jgi:hypothetical protein